MSQAEELLDSLSEGETATYALTPDEEPHIVINADRSITVPDALKEIAVQFDHNIETVTFDCPRSWDGHDLSKMHMYVNYQRSDGYKDSYPVDNLRVDESDDSIIHFEWTISSNVTLVKGNVTFLACAKLADDNGILELHWNSKPSSDLKVLEGLDCVEGVVEQNPDIIEQILAQLDTSDDVNLEGVPYKKLIGETSETKWLHVYAGYHDYANHSSCLQHKTSEYPDFIDFALGDKYRVEVTTYNVDTQTFSFNCEVIEVGSKSDEVEDGVIGLHLVDGGIDYGIIYQMECSTCGDVLRYKSTGGNSLGTFSVSIFRLATFVTKEYDIEKIDKDCLPEGYPYIEDKTVITNHVLTWDGNTEGLESVEIPADPPIMVYRAFDSVLTDEQIKQSTLNIAYVDNINFIANWENMVSAGLVTENFVVVSDKLIFVRKDNTDVTGLMFPKAGVYVHNFGVDVMLVTPIQLKTSKPEFVPISNDYLPKNIPHTTEQNIDVENTAGEEMLLDGFPAFKGGDTVDITVNGVDYSLTAYFDDGCIIIGDTAVLLDLGEPVYGWTVYCFLDENDGNEKAAFFSNEKCTISYKGEPIFNKLDARYLPDGYPYEEERFEAIKVNTVYDCSTNDYYIQASENINSDQYFEITPGMYKVIYDGKEYRCTTQESPYGYVFGNMAIPQTGEFNTQSGYNNAMVSKDDTGEPFAFLWGSYDQTTLEVFSIEKGLHIFSIYKVEETAVPMAEKFLPQGIGGLETVWISLEGKKKERVDGIEIGSFTYAEANELFDKWANGKVRVIIQTGAGLGGGSGSSWREAAGFKKDAEDSGGTTYTISVTYTTPDEVKSIRLAGPND